jgi:gamma-glutamylputrescine oxidase
VNASATAARIPVTDGAGPWGEPIRTTPLVGAHSAAVAVVGGGLTGLSTALHLLRARPGLDVVVLDAGGLGGGQTGRSTGMLTPGVGQDLPGQVRRFGPELARRMYEATLDAVRAAQALVEAERIECDLHLGGQLIVAHGEAGRRRLATLERTLTALQLPCEPLDDAGRDAAVKLGPALRAPGPGTAALRLPIAGTLQPLSLVAGLAARVQALGGRIHTDTPVVALGDRLTLREGTLDAGRVVVAAGPGAPGLGLQRGRVLPMELRACVTAPLSTDALARLGWARREGVIDSRRLFDYFRLSPDGRLVFGGGRPVYRWRGRPGPDAPSAKVRAALARDLARAVPGAPPIEAAWTGRIDYTVDGLPVVGADARGVVHAGGWCGHGIALSLSAGRWAAALALGEAPPVDPTLPWLRPAAPWVPTELARWVGVKAVVASMALADR